MTVVRRNTLSGVPQRPNGNPKPGITPLLRLQLSSPDIRVDQPLMVQLIGGYRPTPLSVYPKRLCPQPLVGCRPATVVVPAGRQLDAPRAAG